MARPHLLESQITLLVWEEEQAAIKSDRDAQRQAVVDAQNNPAAQTGARTAQAGAPAIPDAYEMKPIPARLKAALDKQ